MEKYCSVSAIKAGNFAPEFKEHLIKKSEDIMAEYGLNDICDIFCVTVLDENEADYFNDKYLEFSEIKAFDGIDYIHTVWIVDDGYSEDIYIPYTEHNAEVIESRCST